MKAIFWVRQERHLEQTDWRENDLAEAIKAGAVKYGDEVEIVEVADGGDPVVRECDLVLKIGVKSRNWFRAYNEAGIPYCYFDKGYIRTRAPIKWLEYWRMSVNGHQPIAFVTKADKDRRRSDALGMDFSSWKEDRPAALLVDGGSGKHVYFNAQQQFSADKAEFDRELHAHANQVAFDLVQQIKGLTDRPIIYRPKPSWKQAKPIPGTEFSRGKPGVGDKDFAYDLRRAHCVITYGSNLCFDAACFGVPSIVLGHGIAGPISSTTLDQIEKPFLASDVERRHWLNNCAWCQWKLEEFRGGMGWLAIREMVECTPL